MEDMQEKVDNLNEEYAQLSRQSLEATTSLRDLEQELMAQMDLLKDTAEGSGEHAQQRSAARETASKASAVKSTLESLELQRGNCLQRLELFKRQLEEKRTQLKQHERKPESERKQQSEKKLQSAVGKAPKKKSKK